MADMYTTMNACRTYTYSVARAADQGHFNDIVLVELPQPVPAEEGNSDEQGQQQQQSMPMEKMRTLLALLLKKISTPGRLKKLGFGTRLIDDVLKESIQASGREPCDEKGLGESEVLSKNIQVLLDWTIPEEYMSFFKGENKSTTEILEELAA